MAEQRRQREAISVRSARFDPRTSLHRRRLPAPTTSACASSARPTATCPKAASRSSSTSSVTNHAASRRPDRRRQRHDQRRRTATTPIFGMLGTDIVHGDDGNDVIASTGNGSYYGDAANDTIYSGLTTVGPNCSTAVPASTCSTRRNWSGAYVLDLAAGTSPTIWARRSSTSRTCATGGGQRHAERDEWRQHLPRRRGRRRHQWPRR